MKVCPLQSTPGDFRQAALEWIALLARGPDDGYQSAWDWLYQPENDEDWTLSLMRNCIETYGEPFDPPGRRYRVTVIPEDQILMHYMALQGEREVGSLAVDLPLDGEPSELTAELTLLRDARGLVFRLDTIAVM